MLTVADTRAVGPNVWNAWKATLLRDLYYAAQEVMTGGLPAQRREARADKARGKLLDQMSDWQEADVETFISLTNSDYLLSYPAEI